MGGPLAPTDPVLAHDVQVRHPGDRDRLRFGLTCEAGINDGTAFPVVMPGLGLRWLAVDVLWTTAAGVVFGFVCGHFTGRLVWHLRQCYPGIRLQDEFLGLGLIGLVYGGSMLINGGGFLGVFFAAVALRQTGLRLAGWPPEPPRRQNAKSPPARKNPWRRLYHRGLATDRCSSRNNWSACPW